MNLESKVVINPNKPTEFLMQEADVKAQLNLANCEQKWNRVKRFAH